MKHFLSFLDDCKSLWCVRACVCITLGSVYRISLNVLWIDRQNRLGVGPCVYSVCMLLYFRSFVHISAHLPSASIPVFRSSCLLPSVSLSHAFLISLFSFLFSLLLARPSLTLSEVLTPPQHMDIRPVCHLTL